MRKVVEDVRVQFIKSEVDKAIQKQKESLSKVIEKKWVVKGDIPPSLKIQPPTGTTGNTDIEDELMKRLTEMKEKEEEVEKA